MGIFMLDRLLSRFQNFQGRVLGLQEQSKEIVSAIGSLTEQTEVLQQSLALLQFISGELSKEVEQQVAELATLALRETFFDQNLSLKIEHTTLRGKPSVVLKIRDADQGVEGDPLESFGGGPASLLAVVLRVITVLRHKNLSKVLFLDEPMAQVSTKYSGEAGKLLKKLCKSVEDGGLGFTILVVTHNEQIAEAADNNYEVSNDQGTSKLKLLSSKV